MKMKLQLLSQLIGNNIKAYKMRQAFFESIGGWRPPFITQGVGKLKKEI